MPRNHWLACVGITGCFASEYALSVEERQQLTALIQTGRRPARQVLKARILLKADASDAGEGWSGSEVAGALDTSVGAVARTRQDLVEGGVGAALTRKHSPRSARKRVFDGVAEAKLIALACSEPPKGRSRWTLQLLDTAVAELNIVARASEPPRVCRRLVYVSPTLPLA